MDSDPVFWEKLVGANSSTPKDVHVVTHELDFVEAAECRHSFDKVLLLTKHGNHSIATSTTLSEPSLTVEGAGQALSLARRISTFCNDETRFLPELVVVAPLRRSIQTTLFTFPQYSPYTVRSVPWICHPAATGTNSDVHDILQLQKEFTGFDYSPCYQKIEATVDGAGATSAEAMLQRANSLLDWIRCREEKIIVGTHIILLCIVRRFTSLPLTLFIDGSISSLSLSFQSPRKRPGSKPSDVPQTILGLHPHFAIASFVSLG